MTTRTSLRWLLLAGAAGALALAAVACGGDDDDDDDTPTTGASATATDGATGTGTTASETIDYGSLSGTIEVDGSSTVYPISQALVEEFSGEAKNVNISVAFSGTGGGFEKFCRGETQVSNASRPIKDSEKDACEKAGITPVEFNIATDALTVVVNPANTWAQCLTTEQLVDVFREGGAKKWSDIDPSWPAEDIKLFYPGADSGTFDYFEEIIVGVNKDYTPATTGTSSEDDNLLVRGVEGDKNAIGYFGLAYYHDAGQGLKAVEINHKGAGCVAPSVENARAGTYVPLSRPLFMYTSEQILAANPSVGGMLDFFYSHAVDLVEEVGYVPLDDATAATEHAKLGTYLH